jgi:excinuclease ABC subunit C
MDYTDCNDFLWPIEIFGIKENLGQLPGQPGVYKFFNSQGELIYVGKAKDLKKRVSNYFNKLSNLDNKTRRLVTQISKIEYTIVNSEFDALLLENSLIKSHQPRYNILLKDGKTYPYILIVKERFPRLMSTRRIEQGEGEYFGPYTSVKAMNTVIELIRKMFYLRTCNYNLSQKNIEEKKFKVCLEFHIGNCKGPCEGFVSEEEYNRNIEQIHHLLKGKVNYAKNYFKEEMTGAAEKLEFEKAQIWKNKLSLLEKFQSTTVIVNPDITDLDVFSIISNDKVGVVNYLKIINGTISQARTIELKKKLDESDEELLGHGIINIREENKSEAKEIVTNIPIEIFSEGIEVTIPRKGDKKKLLDLSLKNIEVYLSKINDNKEPGENRILKTLQNDLQLKELPDHIECFDNSNIHGSAPVAAMVYFKDGKPFKKGYRHFNIKTVTGPNDFDSMHEIVFRRYKRVLEEGAPLPRLIIIDGGKGQLTAACKALNELGMYGQVPVIGIAKRLEEIYFPEDKDPLHISKKSESLRLIQKIRDEAHRFAITFHRQKRSKSLINSKLSEIPGVGPKIYEKLLRRFKSLSGIKNASLEELSEITGEKLAGKIKENLTRG